MQSFSAGPTHSWHRELHGWHFPHLSRYVPSWHRHFPAKSIAFGQQVLQLFVESQLWQMGGHRPQYPLGPMVLPPVHVHDPTGEGERATEEPKQEVHWLAAPPEHVAQVRWQGRHLLVAESR